MATIQEVYIALFGRPADPIGLAYYNEATDNGANLDAVGALSSSPEYLNRFEGQNDVQMINQIYNDLFGRDADASGLLYYVQLLQSGQASIQDIAIRIIDGATGSDDAIIAAKVEAANLFTASLNEGDEIVAYSGEAGIQFGQAFLNQIDSADDEFTQAQVDAQIEAFVENDDIPGGGPVGNIFTLTDSTVTGIADNVTGSANADTIRAPLLGGNNSLETADTINGGAGTDTLNATLVNGSNVSPVLNGVERVNISTAAAGTVTLDGSAATGLEQVRATNVTGGNGSSVLNVTGISTAVAIGITDTDAGDNDDLDVNATFTGVGGTNDTANVVLSGSDTGSTVTVNGIENFNVNVEASSIATLETTAANIGETITITGAGNLTLGVGVNLDDQLETVDASAMTGALSLTTTLNQNATVTGGSGADTLALTSAGTVVLTVNSGAGNDTVNFDANQEHTITLGGGVDTVNVDVTALTGGQNLAAGDIVTAGDLADAAVQITDFVSADDTLNINATVATEVTLTGTQMSDVADEANLLDALNRAETLGGVAAGETVVFEFGGNTYVYTDESADGVLSAGDALIELTGVTGLNGGDVVVV